MTAIRVPRHPLFWFLFIGSALFVADAWLSDRPEEIVVNEAVRNRLGSLWETQMGQPPSEKQLDSLVENWLREEVFYREALRLQLDKGDTIIRRRLIQKLNFIAEDVNEPDQATLRAFYEKNKGDYTLPTRYSFSQIYFSQGNRKALEDARKQLLDNEVDWRELGEPGMFTDSYAARSSKQIASTFGDKFAEQIESLKPGDWHGPVRSAFGLHLVKVSNRQAAESAGISSVEREVLNDYLHQQRQRARSEYYQQLLDRYDIVRQD